LVEFTLKFSPKNTRIKIRVQIRVVQSMIVEFSMDRFEMAVLVFNLNKFFNLSTFLNQMILRLMKVSKTRLAIKTKPSCFLANFWVRPMSLLKGLDQKSLTVKKYVTIVLVWQIV
jgi:hypothetical protein